MVSDRTRREIEMIKIFLLRVNHATTNRRLHELIITKAAAKNDRVKLRAFQAHFSPEMPVTLIDEVINIQRKHKIRYNHTITATNLSACARIRTAIRDIQGLRDTGTINTSRVYTLAVRHPMLANAIVETIRKNKTADPERIMECISERFLLP